MRITETKRHLDGGAHRFDCELLRRRPHAVAVRFEHWEGRSAGGFAIPRGSHTDAVFWKRRPYSLYRMAGPDSEPIADRFDILEDVRLEEHEVSYLDLLVDIWVAPDGAVAIEDEDEVEDHIRRGLLSDAQVRRIERTKGLLVRDHRRIIQSAAYFLAGR